MLNLLKMAIRNVGRNRRRTFITVFTVVLGTVVVIQVRGLINGLQGEMIRNLTRKVNGDIQMHRAGYKDNLDANPFDYLLKYDSLEEQKLEAEKLVTASAPRLRVFGLINDQRTQKTTPVFITGLDPVRELEVCPRLRSGVESGVFFEESAQAGSSQATSPQSSSGQAAPPSSESIEEASELNEAEASKPRSPAHSASYSGRKRIPVLLTPSLARGLRAQLGDEMVILLKDSTNMEQAILAEFTGTLEMNLPMAAAKMIWIDIRELRKSLHLGEFASEIVLSIPENADIYLSQKKLQAEYGADVQVERWDEVAGFFTDVMGLQNAVFRVVLAIMFIIVSSAIINTSMMTVSERVREIGTLMAIGYKRRHILTIFLMESTTIGLLGGLSGTLVGVSGVLILRQVGLRFSFPGTKVPFVIQPFVTTDFVLFVLFLACFSALFAGIYPSYRASRMSPVKALTSN